MEGQDREIIDRVKMLSEMSKETIGCSPSMDFMKDGTVRVKIVFSNTRRPVLLDRQRDPENALRSAIEYIERKRTFDEKLGQYTLNPRLW